MPDSQHLWSGRFAGAPDEEVFRFQASLAFDRQLFEDDVAARITARGSVAARQTPQSTSPAAVKAALEAARTWVAASR